MPVCQEGEMCASTSSALVEAGSISAFWVVTKTLKEDPFHHRQLKTDQTELLRTQSGPQECSTPCRAHRPHAGLQRLLP